MKDKLTLERIIGIVALLVLGPGQFGMSLPTRERAQVEEMGRKTAWEAFYDEQDKRDLLQVRLDEKVEELHECELQSHPH